MEKITSMVKRYLFSYNFSVPSEVFRGEVSKVDFILKNISVYYTSVIRNRFVWVIRYSGIGLSFYFTVPSLFLTKSFKFSSQKQHHE